MKQALAIALALGLRRWAMPPRLTRARRWSLFLGAAHGWRRFGGASTKRGGLWLWAIAAEKPRSFSRALFDGWWCGSLAQMRVREREGQKEEEKKKRQFRKLFGNSYGKRERRENREKLLLENTKRFGNMARSGSTACLLPSLR